MMTDYTCFLCRRQIDWRTCGFRKDGWVDLSCGFCWRGSIRSGHTWLCPDCGKKPPFPKMFEAFVESYLETERMWNEFSSKGQECGDG